MTRAPAIDAALARLGIDRAQLAARKLERCVEATRFACAGVGTDGRDKFLVPAAAAAWQAMQAAAARDNVELLLISAFRSVEFQTQLIERKLEKGRALADVLTVNAPPGYSEHHSGRAIDIGTAGAPALEEDFENTPAFAWLTVHAARFGFSLSYPRDNPQGYVYEPWHWCHRPLRRKAARR